MKISENSCSIERNTLNKKIDLAFPVKLKNKDKNYLLCLHDQLLSIYNDKLILQCHKELSYNASKIKGACQIKNHLFVVEENKIIRINLHNMNEIFEKPFSEPLSAVAPS